MEQQRSFAEAEFMAKKKTTRREKFLAGMEAAVPWAELLAVIKPFYPQGRRGRPPLGLERMLRVDFLQQWSGLADEALEDALYDRQARRGFARIDLAKGVPDATTRLNFRHLLAANDLCQGLFAAVNADLAARGLRLREGTLVAATLIAAPSSTKNRAQQRAPTFAHSLIRLFLRDSPCCLSPDTEHAGRSNRPTCSRRPPGGWTTPRRFSRTNC